MGILTGKNILIMGVRNKWSIAWGIAQMLKKEDANLILTYLGDREKDSIDKLIAGIEGISTYKCDISSDDEIKSAMDNLKDEFGVLHGLVHSIAHANAEDMKNDFVYTSREGFAHALDVSAYSLIAVSKYAKELMTEGGSILTLTHLGAEKVFPGYNVMGVAKAALEASVRYLAHDLGRYNIRVNALSAGPVKTMSAKGVPGLNMMLDKCENNSPLKSNITLENLGGTALYAISDLSGGLTGEVIHLDCGYSIMGI